MAYGDHPEDEALLSAWKQFCRNLEEAGERVFKEHNPATSLHRADGFRFLTQNLGQAFDLALETKNTKYPVIHAFCGPFRKLGGDNADYTYQQAWIDGQSVYRISGNIGTCKFFNIAVQGARPVPKPGMRGLHDPFGDTPQANMFGHDMVVGWDGSFEVYIGGEKRGPELAADHARHPQAVHPPGLRRLVRTAGDDADRADRHDRAAPDARCAGNGPGDRLGEHVRFAADDRLAGLVLRILRGLRSGRRQQVRHRTPSARRSGLQSRSSTRCAGGRSRRCAGGSSPTRR